MAAVTAAAAGPVAVGKTSNVMKSLLTPEDEALLIAAIREQEARTSAEIRICITPKFILRHERYARQLFEKNGMTRTRHRNAALIVMMPFMRKIVIIGDSGLNAVVSPDFWKEAVGAMIRQMHDTGPLEALREGLRRLGDTLSTNWPREADDVNELSDEILK